MDTDHVLVSVGNLLRDRAMKLALARAKVIEFEAKRAAADRIREESQQEFEAIRKHFVSLGGDPAHWEMRLEKWASMRVPQFEGRTDFEVINS